MTENKTKPTDVSVDEFLATVSEQRRAEAKLLIDLMQKISGEQPVMWGPSIIGFGLQHYKYDSGHEGSMGKLGFSPRKAAITIYFAEGFDRYSEELERLGKYMQSVSCLYIKKLADIDIAVLHTMLQKSYAVSGEPKKAIATVDDYVANVPHASRPLFDELRALVREQIPQAEEVLSYGIVGYKTDEKRARVFVSGWKDHVALYPVPHDEALRAALAPYQKGKGTLWFMLGKPLPKQLIVRVVAALVR